MTKDTPTPRTDALRAGINVRSALRTFIVPQDVTDALELAETLERDLSACRAALRAVVTNANGRRESGYADVPWTTIDAARAILPAEGETK